MSKRDEQRRQADRTFEECRQAIANLSDEELCESLLDVPHRRWLEIEKDTHMAIGIIAHRAAQRIAELTRAPLQQPDVREIDRLHAVEAAALRVASSRRDGIVTDQGPLDRLDAALEGRTPFHEREPPHCSTCVCGMPASTASVTVDTLPTGASEMFPELHDEPLEKPYE